MFIIKFPYYSNHYTVFEIRKLSEDKVISLICPEFIKIPIEF